MSTDLVLDFGKIRDPDEELPDIGVADFIPVKAGSRVEVSPIKGIVLELNNRKSLKRGFDVPVGPAMFYVHLPTGETLVERVDVEPVQGQKFGKLRLAVQGQQRLVSNEVIGYSRKAPPSDTVRAVRSSEGADRSRWKTVKFAKPSMGQRPERRRLDSFVETFASKVVSERDGHRGIAKLQSSAGSFRADGRQAGVLDFDAALVGSVRAAKPTKLYGSGDDLHAAWRQPLSTKPKHGAREECTDRLFALSYEAIDKAEPLQVACVPARWRTMSKTPAQLSVQYVSDRSKDEGRRGRVVVNVEDQKFKALLQFMQTGDLASSVSLLREAELALYRKFTNPYAAAAGGYVLTHAGYHYWQPDWGHWLHNLASHFPALPDGHILLSNLILQGPEEAKLQLDGYSRRHGWHLALESVLEAVRRGPPLYRFGIRMLLSNMAILNHLVDAKHPDRRRLDTAVDYVRNLSVRVDRHQPFCVFDVGRNAP